MTHVYCYALDDVRWKSHKGMNLERVVALKHRRCNAATWKQPKVSTDILTAGGKEEPWMRMLLAKIGRRQVLGSESKQAGRIDCCVSSLINEY